MLKHYNNNDDKQQSVLCELNILALLCLLFFCYITVTNCKYNG